MTVSGKKNYILQITAFILATLRPVSMYLEKSMDRQVYPNLLLVLNMLLV